MQSSWRKDIVAVTGTIGSGKTTVAKMLGQLGAYVVSADDLAREAVKKGTPGLQRIVEAFGATILTKQKTLNRKKLAGIVFSDPKQRRRLEKITHPIIRKLAQERFARARRRYSVLVYEIPLLFEVGMNPRDFKAVVVVTAPVSASIHRLVHHKHLSPAMARARLSAQIAQKEKIKSADYVIHNTGLKSYLRRQVRMVYQSLHVDSAGGRGFVGTKRVRVL